MTRPGRGGAAAPLGRGLAIPLVAIAAGGAAAAPLLTYALSLAAFGLPHVLAELRYVDGRFSRRLGTTLGPVVLGGLAGIVLVRALALAGRLEVGAALRWELAAVAGLALVVLPRLRGAASRTAPAVLVGGALGAGAAVDPVGTAVVLAVLHNATPIGFLAERLRGPARRRALAACAVAFVAVPLALASGIPGRALEALGLAAREASWATAGVAHDHLHVFVPSLWRHGPRALDLFAAAAYLQVLHHLTVLLVLPRLARSAPMEDRPVLPWPPGPVLAAGLVLVGLVAFAHFARDFRGTRAAYGLLAAVHAWIEVPVLLLALGPGTASAALRPSVGARP